MKKWFRIFVTICLVLLLGTGSIRGINIANRANVGEIQEDNGFISQVVQCNRKNYVIYKSADGNKYQVVNVDKNREQYEAVGTLHLTRPYYVYSFVNDAKQCWGVEPVDLDKEETWSITPLEAEGTFLAAGGIENKILVSILGNDGRTIKEYVLSLDVENSEWKESVVFSLTEDNFIVSGAYDGETLIVARDDGTILLRDVVVKELDVAPQESILAKCFDKEMLNGAERIWKMHCVKVAVVESLIPVLLVSAFLTLLFVGRKQSHMIYHMIICSEIICMLGFLIIGYVFSQRLTKQEVMETGIETGYVLEALKAGQRADGTVDADEYWRIVKRYEDLLEDVIILDPTVYEIIQAKTMPCGMDVSNLWDKDVTSLIQKIAEGNKTIMKKEGKSSGNYMVATRDFTQMEPDSLLLAIISQKEMDKRIETAVSVIWEVIFLLMVIITILHMFVFLFFAEKWKKFLEGMQYVAEEKQAYADRPMAEDGLRSAWAPLDRIGHNMLKLRYERELMYRNYYRFVPKGMEQLLKKTEMADIEIGDNNTVSGCMVHFRMENIKNVSQKDYMDIMTESLTLMHQIREKQEGIFISADGDLLNRKVFFERSTKDALKFAIELYHDHAVKEKLVNTNVIMMLHKADYYYGVSGVEEMLTPYIYCAEEKILDSYRDALADAKLRIVVTEQMFSDVREEFSTRYIGFVSGGAMIGSIKLYECLDAYTEEKRKIMIDSDVYFQKALKLFYSNDFYLARNIFNEVLRMNEEDEIARWYLFHCEYHLNKPETEVAYGLFENIICEKKSYQL